MTEARIIDLDTERRSRWHDKIRRMRELGDVAIFGTIGEHDAVVLPFPIQPSAKPTTPEGAA